MLEKGPHAMMNSHAKVFNLTALLRKFFDYLVGSKQRVVHRVLVSPWFLLGKKDVLSEVKLVMYSWLTVSAEANWTIAITCEISWYAYSKTYFMKGIGGNQSQFFTAFCQILGQICSVEADYVSFDLFPWRKTHPADMTW